MRSRGKPLIRRSVARAIIAIVVSAFVLTWWAAQHGGTRQPRDTLIDQSILVAIEPSGDGVLNVRVVDTYDDPNSEELWIEFEAAASDTGVEAAAIIHVWVIKWLGFVPKGVRGFEHITAWWSVLNARAADGEVGSDEYQLALAADRCGDGDWRNSLAHFLTDELAPRIRFEYSDEVAPSLELSDHGVGGYADVSNVRLQLAYIGVSVLVGTAVGVGIALLLIPPARWLTPPSAPQ